MTKIYGRVSFLDRTELRLIRSKRLGVGLLEHTCHSHWKTHHKAMSHFASPRVESYPAPAFGRVRNAMRLLMANDQN